MNKLKPLIFLRLPYHNYSITYPILLSKSEPSPGVNYTGNHASQPSLERQVSNLRWGEIVFLAFSRSVHRTLTSYYRP